jgi:hypothetical protein
VQAVALIWLGVVLPGTFATPDVIVSCTSTGTADPIERPDDNEVSTNSSNSATTKFSSNVSSAVTSGLVNPGEDLRAAAQRDLASLDRGSLLYNEITMLGWQVQSLLTLSEVTCQPRRLTASIN